MFDYSAGAGRANEAKTGTDESSLTETKIDKRKRCRERYGRRVDEERETKIYKRETCRVRGRTTHNERRGTE